MGKIFTVLIVGITLDKRLNRIVVNHVSDVGYVNVEVFLVLIFHQHPVGVDQRVSTAFRKYIVDVLRY
jgi:hypothetical protein